jgi:hypothetical protein
MSSYWYCTIHVGMLRMFNILYVSTKMEEGIRESIPQSCLQEKKIVMKMWTIWAAKCAVKCSIKLKQTTSLSTFRVITNPVKYHYPNCKCVNHFIFICVWQGTCVWSCLAFLSLVVFESYLSLDAFFDLFLVNDRCSCQLQFSNPLERLQNHGCIALYGFPVHD